MKKNRKTTIGGILAAVGLALTNVANPAIHTAGVIISAVGTLLMGGAAKDAGNDE